MYRSIPQAPSNKRVFGACLLSFMTLMSPIASVAAASPNYLHPRGAAPLGIPGRSTSAKTTPATGNSKATATTTSEAPPVGNTSESLDAQEAALFLPAADAASTNNSLFASASAGVAATSLFLPAFGDVTATMAASLVPADDVNSDGFGDPGEKITYTPTLK